jgi:hypothetical protein
MQLWSLLVGAECERASSVLILVVVATRAVGREQVQNSQTVHRQVSPLQAQSGFVPKPEMARDGCTETHKPCC